MTEYRANVPSSIALPSDPDDQSPDYDVEVVFDWTEGCPPAPRTMAEPMGGDDGSGDEFDIIASGSIAGVDLSDNIVEAIVEYLDENWTRPGYDPPDDWRE